MSSNAPKFKEKPEEALRLTRGEFNASTTLDEIREHAAMFARERDWDQFHMPRNLVLALVGEVGELCEIFQWKGEVAPGLPRMSSKEIIHVGEEMSDVLIYLLRLADKCNIDLPSSALRKMKLNAIKYPSDKARGKADKYTAYMEMKQNDTDSHDHSQTGTEDETCQNSDRVVQAAGVASESALTIENIICFAAGVMLAIVFMSPVFQTQLSSLVRAWTK